MKAGQNKNKKNPKTKHDKTNTRGIVQGYVHHQVETQLRKAAKSAKSATKF